MTTLLLLPLWIQSWLIHAPPTVLVASTQNLVRICAESAGASALEGCPVFNAQDLEPHPTTAPAQAALHGQLAFVDPETLELVQPTQEQLDEITNLILSEETPSKGGEPVIETLADGTMRLHVGERFQVHLTASVRISPPQAAVTSEVEKP